MGSTEGRLFKSENKKFKEVIFFVHFYEGSLAALRKHIRMVNDLGFDAFAFDLVERSIISLPVFNSKFKFGLKHIYTDQIEKLLNQIPGDKIVFTFSNPSAAVIEALAARYASDVKALICDSGPSFRLKASTENLLHWNKKFPFWLSRLINPFYSFAWSPQFHHDTLPQLEKLPSRFPVLTLLCENDLLIPPEDTVMGFRLAKNIIWKNYIFSDAGHLLGLKSHPEEYKKQVAEFLNQFATKI